MKQRQYCNKFNKNFKNGPYQKNKKKKNHTSIEGGTALIPGLHGKNPACRYDVAKNKIKIKIKIKTCPSPK